MRKGQVGSPTLHQSMILHTSVDRQKLWESLILRNGFAACNLPQQSHELLFDGYGFRSSNSVLLPNRFRKNRALSSSCDRPYLNFLCFMHLGWVYQPERLKRRF